LKWINSKIKEQLRIENGELRMKEDFSSLCSEKGQIVLKLFDLFPIKFHKSFTKTIALDVT
jgi:hypothetical protein